MGSDVLVTSTTQFLDSSQAEKIVVREKKDNSLTVGAVDDSDIKTFMAKPVVLNTFSYTSSAPAGASIFSYNIEDLLSGVGSKTIWANKISGYRLFRGTFVLRIVINAQPFQAGRLILTFLPQSRNFRDYSLTFTNIHNANVTTITQQPNVEVDIKEGVAEMEVPFVAPSNWLSREESFGFGAVSCFVLSPLRSAAATSLDVTVYGFFKDFEVTAPQFGPEMNAPMEKKSTAERKRTRKTGVVSNFLDAVAKPFDLLRGVPIIGQNAGLISDATVQVSKVFSMFGWSRPIDMSPPCAMRLQPNYQAFSYNGQNMSDVLALDSVNQVAPMDNFGGSGVDEMSFNYLKAIPALYTTFQVSTSDASQSVVFTQSVSLPDFTHLVVTSGPGSYLYTTKYAPPFVYLSRYFNYWRGGIVITLKFVKTCFHSARYEVTYTPSNTSIAAPASANPYLLREIIDISGDNDTFSFIIPYYSEVPWQSCGWRAEDPDFTNNGVFRINVLNKLVASSTVASVVDVLVYACAAEDFQLSTLIGINKPAFVPEMNISRPLSECVPRPIILAPEMAAPRVVGAIADARLPDMSIDASALCSGEIFTSVKQLYQCSRPINIQPSEAATFAATNFWPYALGVASYGPSAGTVKLPSWYGDYLSEIGLGFAYNRGGIRIFSPQSMPGNSISYLGFVFPGDFINAGVDNFPGPTLANVLADKSTLLAPPANRTSSGCSIDTIVPHGSKLPFRLSYPVCAASDKIPSTKDSPMISLNFRYPVPTTTYVAETARVYRSGADDYASAYFIGFPGFLDSIGSPL